MSISAICYILKPMEEKPSDRVMKYYVRRAGDRGETGDFRPRFRDFHRLTMTGDYLYPEHRHGEYEVIRVEKGPYRCFLNGRMLSLEDGQILLIKPGDRHRDILRKGQTHQVLHFSLKKPLFKAGCPPEGQILNRPIPGVPALLKRMEEESLEGDSFSGAIQDALLEQFFWDILRRIPGDCLSEEVIIHSRRENFLQSLNDSFERHCREDFSMDALAGELGLSRRTLSNRCRDYLGDSPGRLFLAYRINRACGYLRGGGKSIKETAHHFGFSSPYNFSRSFLGIKGVRPSRYGNIPGGEINRENDVE